MKKTILLTFCLISIAGSAMACGGAKMPDGTWFIKGKRQTIGNVEYICCGDTCLTAKQWIHKFENDKPVDYMKDLRESELPSRSVLSEL